MPSGFQDFWVVGSRFYYKRDDVDAVEQPTIDLGVIETVNPNLTIEKIELEDADGGLKTTVDERVTKIDETYDITCSNLNLENLSLLFLADPPSDFTQAATELDYSATVQTGRLYKLTDGAATPTNVYNIATVAGVIDESGGTSTTTAVINAISKSLKRIDVTGDIASELSVGEAIIVEADGLANIKNSRTYTIVSATFNTPDTEIVVNEEPVADESSITGVLRYQGAADVGVVLKPDGVDYSVHSLDRGLIRFTPGGAIAADGTCRFIFSPTALSGKRLINPQEVKGEIQGDGILVWGRGNNADQTVREARISITPNSANFQVDNFSNFVLSVRVISDLGAAKPAGRLLHFKGTVPAVS